jgi:hypothetical protein
MKNSLTQPVHSLRQKRGQCDIIAVLIRILTLQKCSVANYLRFARPWTNDSDRVLLATIFKIADVQRANAHRVGQVLVDRRASPLRATFDTELTSLNYVSIRYAAAQVARDLESIIKELRACLATLRDDHEVARLVQKVLADEQCNLAMLQKELDLLESEALGVADEDRQSQPTVREHDTRRRAARTSPQPLAA